MTYPRKFDSSNLSQEQQDTLKEFSQRRKLFDTYLHTHNIKLFTCPGCGYPTLPERGGYDICMVCNWENDLQDDKEADEIWGGPNYDLSLTENRLDVGMHLKDLAVQMAGEINTNAAAVLKILAQYDRHIEKLVATITDEPAKEEAVYKAYRRAGRNLLLELVKK